MVKAVVVELRGEPQEVGTDRLTLRFVRNGAVCDFDAVPGVRVGFRPATATTGPADCGAMARRPGSAAGPDGASSRAWLGDYSTAYVPTADGNLGRGTPKLLLDRADGQLLGSFDVQPYTVGANEFPAPCTGPGFTGRPRRL